ncbi:MAG: GYD domain-containing protein [Gammaproteobacteria bacterium]
MPTYLYQLAYTPESLAAQIQQPQDRLVTAAKPVADSVGGKVLGGGYAFGDFDLALLIDAPDDESMAAVAIAVAAGGSVKASKTTKLLSGEQWVSALEKSGQVVAAYKPAK